MTNDEIVKYLGDFDKTVKRLKQVIATLCWYMRGMSYGELMAIASTDIQQFQTVLSENVELSKKTKQLII